MYLYGASGHAKVILEVLQSNNIQVCGFFDDNENLQEFYGLKVEKGIKLNDTKTFELLNDKLIISIGDNYDRAQVAKAINIAFGTAIHPTAIISETAQIGVGSVVLQGSIIQAEAIIGKHVIINTGASIDHENVLEDFVHVSPHGTLCGNVHVGEGTHIGAGAIVLPNLKIGKWCKIGAGTIVIRDIPDYTTAVGNPARILEGKTVKILE